MFTKEWKAKYGGHTIVVHNWDDPVSQRSEAKLYIDDELVDNCEAIIARGDIPLLRGSLPSSDGMKHSVEVFVKSTLFSVKAKILVDSQLIGGDSF